MALPKPLFWLGPLKRIVWDPFWWVILLLLILFVPFIRVWWWIFLPLMLQKQLKRLYFWWLDWDFAYAKAKWIVLEIVPPKEILIPLKAMEDVFSVVWPIWDRANFRDEWIDGELNNGPFWYSWEIASIEGKVHFYIRFMLQHKIAVETALYGHYPDLEIREVPDYVKLVPPTVPNDEWDIYGEDWEYGQKNSKGEYLHAYPIKTYEKFFEPQGERISAEEKRIDPIISLLELMSRLGPGEHYWVQFITVPINDNDEPGWKKDGASIINKLSKRPEKKDTTAWQDFTYLMGQVIFGPAKTGSGEKASYEWLPQNKEETGEREMVLTPGERDIITEVEKKLSKPAFRTSIRGVYVAKRDDWKSSHASLLRSYMAHFKTNNMNDLRFSSVTRPKVNFFMRKRRAFSRARKMYRNAINRFPALFPDRKGLCVILSTEELATLYHFPLRVSGMVAPTMGNVEAKKAGPPSNLPIE